MSGFSLQGHSHRRYNPLTQQWILVSPHRSLRPWHGEGTPPPAAPTESWRADCYLCPGSVRAGGARNPKYDATFVFDNDYPALLPDVPFGDVDRRGLLVALPERGICRMGCYSPRHDARLATLERAEMRSVVDMWVEQYERLSAVDFVRHVLIFENNGIAMGVSNPHPHCQIWATEHVPEEPIQEQTAQRLWRAERHSCLLCDYARLEVEVDERVVIVNRSFVALVPFWATWPFETMVLPRRHLGGMDEFEETERDDLADLLGRLAGCYDALFGVPFPYSMGFHQRPKDGSPHEEWHLHAHYYPPLLRSATIRKLMAGFELLGMPQRDLTPEAAAERLRAVVAAKEPS